MNNSNPHKSRYWQLDAVGIVLLALLGLTGWGLVHPFTVYSVLPLCLLGYAVWRIIFELTWNRHNVPTLATGFVARRKIAGILRKAAEETKPARGDRPFTIIDLGSGRGELARYLGSKVPDSHIIGVEMAKIPHKQAQFLQRCFGPSNVTFECLDFLPYDSSKADAVIMYLSGNLTIKVGDKLNRELRPGSLVIANTFPLNEPWHTDTILRYRTPFKEKLFIYRK
ncbi:MAG: class I SAM-dependent methyltransferase [Alphaproteobacteria bacterium]|nr:class I SAM-dependent methyltransferase [Alphaproteobacteria bacterium]